MKRANILGIFLVLGGACGEPKEEDAVEIAPIGEISPVEVTVSAEPLPEPVHGGTVVLVGERPIEIVGDEEGAFDAYFLAEPPEAPQDVRITIRIPDTEGRVRPVLLSWNPGEARFTGRLRGARPAPGPFEVVLKIGDEQFRAHAPTFVLVAPSVRVAAPTVVVEAPDEPAEVVVDPASAPAVVVERPSAPQLVVEAPEPPEPPKVVAAPPVPPAPPGVVVRPPAPPAPPGVVVRPPAPPAPPGVVVRPPAPPAPPSVVVRSPEPPRGRVVVGRSRPPEARVVVRGSEPRGRVIGRGERGRNDRGRGHGRRKNRRD